MKNDPVYIGSTGSDNQRFVVVQRGDAVYDLPLRLDLFNHSPSGLNWGYGGSGPAQLALALLSDFFGRNRIGDLLATMLHQDFKGAIIAKIEGNSWTMTVDYLIIQLRTLWRNERDLYDSRVDDALHALAFEDACKILDTDPDPDAYKRFDAVEAALYRDYFTEASSLLEPITAD